MTVPYNPQQNGVVERKNRTICEAAKAMMFDQDLPNSLWAEATSTAVYMQNRCSHAILKDETPKEVFSRIKQIEVSRDVTFHEEAAFKKSRELQQ
jgi:hypothetical protein